MNKVKILIEGYAKVNIDGTWDASSSITLIDTGSKKIIVDPGCNRKLLLDSLSKEKLTTGDIDVVFITHYHPDHCLLMGIFENAVVMDSVQYQKGPIGGDVGNEISKTDIKIIKTPGHSLEHSSLLVETEKGKILVGADIFWWKESEEQIIDVERHDDFASDMKTLIETRKEVLKIADYIIPGHGKMFKVEK